MALGINLSFCVKRWVTPKLWAPIVREELGLDLVQFSFDLVDPLWPDAVLADCAAQLREAAAGCKLHIHSAFIGLAHYTFNQLLHPDHRVRDFAETWLERAYAFAAMAGIEEVGGPAGAIASRRDGLEEAALPPGDYDDLVARLRRLARKARQLGLKRLAIEPTPMRREWPWTIAQALQLSRDLEDAALPFSFCLDWGHATIRPLYGEAGASMEPWLRQLGPNVGMIHLQQTDFELDRHWDFTRNGLVDPIEAAALLKRTGHSGKPVFIEVFYPFEQTDAAILNSLRQTAELLKPAFAGI